MTWPSVSVIIPSYSQGRYIERTLLSILRQGYPGPLQVIVSDGGSTDETVAVLRRYPQVLWWSERDAGFVDAVTKGLAAATGEIVAIQSSDDYYLKGAIARAAAALRDDPGIDFVTGNDIFIGENGQPVYPIPKPYVTLTNPGAMFSRTTALYIPQHCTFARRSAIDRVGGLREAVDYCADTDLWYRLLHFGRALMLPDYLAAYQIHAAQRTQSRAEHFIQAHKKVVEDAEHDPVYAARFVPTPQMKRDIFLQWEINWNHTAGGEEGIRKSRILARQALERPENWPDYMIQFLTAFATEPPMVPEARAHATGPGGVRKMAQGWLLKMRSNPGVRAVFGRDPLAQAASAKSTAPETHQTTPDLDWWREGAIPENV